MKNAKLIAAFALVSTVANPLSAGQCGYDYCWGAVAFNAITGSYGYSASYFSEAEAMAAAQDGCRYDCPEVKTFYNACGAAAIGVNGGYGWGFGRTQYEAEDIAFGHCSNYDVECQVLVWACSH